MIEYCQYSCIRKSIDNFVELAPALSKLVSIVGLDMLRVLTAADAASSGTEEVAILLETHSTAGLTDHQVTERRRVHGDNEFSVKEETPLWQRYLEQFKDPLIIMLLCSAVISLCMRQYDDAFSITMAIIIVVTVAFIQEYRSEKSLEALTKLVPPKCHCIRNGIVEDILAQQLVPGDLILIGTGDRVPADVRLLEAVDLSVDESSFTGETTPAVKTTLPHPQDAVVAPSNIAYMGTFVYSGHGKGIVIATGEHTEFGGVFKMMQLEESPKTPLQKSLGGLGTQLSFYSLIIIGVITLLGWIKGMQLMHVLTIGVSLAVAAIPEGLPIVVTVTLALGVIRMAHKHAIVKKLPIVETLGCVTVVCSDKTGTLTCNEMTVTELYTSDGRHFSCDHDDIYDDNGVMVCCHDDDELTRLIEVGMVCNNAYIRDNKPMGHPTEAAILGVGLKAGLQGLADQYVRSEERAFSSEHKWMAVRSRLRSTNKFELPSNKEVWYMKGAVERVLAHCVTIGNGIPITAHHSKQFLELVARLGNKGLRVVAMAAGDELNHLSFAGVMAMWDPPRPQVQQSINTLLSGGVSIKMITGDAMETAVAIGRSLGLDTNTVLSGEDLDNLEPKKCKDIINKVSLFYRVSPKHKLTIVKALQSCGHIVAMTGDGTNDAVALKRADIGIAMGCTGTDVCCEAADMILTNDNFATILSAVEEGKSIFYNIRNFLRFQLSTSIAALTLVAVSTILNMPNPLNAMQILWINIIMDGPPAQSLGVEPVDSDVMKSPPRRVKQSIVSLGLLLQIISSSAIIVSGTLWIFWREMQDNIITPRDTTMTFTCFVFFDMFNALSCRSMNKSILSIGLTTNKTFVVAVGTSLVGQLLVIYFPPLQAIFLTEPLYLTDLLLLATLTSTVLLVDELRKFLSSPPTPPHVNTIAV